jgi:Leucine-rich repeat (LRR) protein
VSLKKLWIKKNQIVNADILFQITSLDLLCIGNNQIESIPETLEKMENLNFLDLSGNKIKVITRGMLKKIRLNIYGDIGIDISRNQISDMIPIINYLEKEHNQEEDKLRWIGLSNNLIEQVPVEIMKFKGIQFSLKENKIKELSQGLSQGL